MTFSNDLRQFSGKVNARSLRIHRICTEEVKRSIVEGSPITGAPGQPVAPVGGGTLKGSWFDTPLGPLLWQIACTGAGRPYSRVIEEGVGRYGALTLRSAVGGFHSVKLTRGGWQKIVNHAQREVVRD